MNEATSGGERRQFSVVLRGPSAAIFEEDVGITVTEVNPTVGPIQLRMTTRWRTLKEGVKLPGHIWLQAVGHANSIDEAMAQFSRSVVVFLPVLSLAANAATGDCELELAFDSSPSATERDYFQSYIPDETSLLREARRIDIAATVKLLEAIQQSPDRERVLRATNQYWLALQSWRFGYESLSVAHLWMAVEALTKAVVRDELWRRGLTAQADLAIALGVDLNKLDSTVRRDIVLRGDVECYDDGKAASDGLEHGFLGFDEIRAKSMKVRNRMAALVRGAIFDLVKLPPEAAEVLRIAPYDKALGNWPLARYLRGKLVGTSALLATPGNAYPFFSWKVSLDKSEPAGGGRVNAQFSESITAHLAPGISFKPERHEVWGQ